MRQDQRSLKQIKEHYEIEKELATKLRNASRQERRILYGSLYDELFTRVRHHPRITQKLTPKHSALRVSSQIEVLYPFLRRDSTFLEVGAGDCSLSFEVAKYVTKVYAVDVSKEITKRSTHPHNFELVLSDGISINVPENSIDLAYSNQLMEHLHPDDAFEQLQNIFNALNQGGIYICFTPNRLSGPHDISRYFDNESKGFHLREYTNQELGHLFQRVGFSNTMIYIRVKKKSVFLPLSTATSCERLVAKLPRQIGKKLACSFPLNRILGIQLIGKK